MSEARKRFFEIADEVQKPGIVYTLTADGKPRMVLLSATEYESLMETLSVYEQFPEIQKDMQEMETAIANKKITQWPSWSEIKAGWSTGMSVAEKSKKHYGVRTPRKSRGKKDNR